MGSKMSHIPNYNQRTIAGRRSAKRGHKPPKFVEIFDKPTQSPTSKKSIRKKNL